VNEYEIWHREKGEAMSAKRKLPEAAYDFWVEDCRDGQKSYTYDTMEEAQRAKRGFIKEWRARFACQLEILWRVNEDKVLALIADAKRRAKR
jgi:hypothetical protein